MSYPQRMIAMVYCCPTTGLSIDHWFEPADQLETYESVICRACNRVHLVNVSNGRVLAARHTPITSFEYQMFDGILCNR